MWVEDFDIDACLQDAMKVPPPMPDVNELVTLCRIAKEKFEWLPNVLRINHPVTIVGSIHAQLGDIHDIFDVCGKPPYTSYMFLGNFVNYGQHNIATVRLLLCLAVKYPDLVFLTRGMHESSEFTRECGLYDEVLNELGFIAVWDSIMEVFRALPVAARVLDRYFCAAGGVAVNKTISDIDAMNRFVEVPAEGELTAIMRAMPVDRDTKPKPFEQDYASIEKFLEGNSLTCLISGNTISSQGSGFPFARMKKDQRRDDSVLRCLTVCSAPNFMRAHKNIGAVVHILGEKVTEGGVERDDFLMMTKLYGQMGEEWKPVTRSVQKLHSADECRWPQT